MTATQREQYLDYLVTHIGNVKKGYDWICTNIPEVIGPEIEIILEENIELHDMSKLSVDELSPYAEYFYGEQTAEIEREFNYAWLHHIHQNPHHWQYWILVHDDEPTEILDMPDEYVIEMICDWWAFSWKSGNLYEIFSWYEQHKEMQLSSNTRQKVESLLDAIKNKLDSLS